MKSYSIKRIFVSFSIIFFLVAILTVFHFKSRTRIYIERCKQCKIELLREHKTEKISLIESVDTVKIERFTDFCKRCEAYRMIYDVLDRRKEMLKDANKLDANGLKVGLWYEFFNDSLLLYRYLQWMYDGYTWVDGKVFDNKGIKANGYYNDGRKNGLWKFNYQNYGDSISISFMDDTIDGDYCEYREDGSLISKSEYKKGLLHGRHKLYREDGSILLEGYYFEGQKDNTWRSFYPDGKEKRRSEYKHGKRIDDY